MKLLSVLGGGPSANLVDVMKLPGYVIGVNDAAVRARCDIVVSMDRLWTEHRWAQLLQMRLHTYIRRSAMKNVKGEWPGLIVFDCDYKSTTFADAPGVLNGINSGYCALNLAFQMRPERLLLFGFDMKRQGDKPYWWPAYPWNTKGATSGGKYQAWAKQFNDAAAQFASMNIEVINCCKDSAITAFPRVDPRKMV